MSSVKEFFEKYAIASLGEDVHHIANHYASDFIIADPSGYIACKNDESFINWLKGVVSYNTEKGIKQMKVLGVATTQLGTSYITAKVTWGASFSNNPGHLIEFDITYTLHKSEEGYKILLYVSHESQEEAMKEHGIN